MVIDGEHHDSHYLVDLGAIWLETLCTSAMIGNMIITLITSPTLAVTLQATIMQMTMTNNDTSFNGHQ